MAERKAYPLRINADVLAAADYVIEVSGQIGGAEQKRLTAFRINR